MEDMGSLRPMKRSSCFRSFLYAASVFALRRHVEKWPARNPTTASARFTNDPPGRQSALRTSCYIAENIGPSVKRGGGALSVQQDAIRAVFLLVETRADRTSNTREPDFGVSLLALVLEKKS